MTNSPVRVFGLLLLAGLATAIGWLVLGRGMSEPISDWLAIFRRGTAELEQLELQAADRDFAQLETVFPREEGLLRNRLITSLVEIDQSLRAIDSGTDPQAIDRAETELPALFDRSEAALTRLREVASDRESTDWLAARLATLRANRLPLGLANSVREATATSLLDRLDKHPDRLALVGPLDELLQPLESDELNERAAAVLSSASERHPRNLFLALLAAQRAVLQQSPAAVALLERIKQLGEPLAEQMDPELKSEGGTAQSLIQQCINFASAGQWEDCEGILIAWNNVALGTQAYRTDRKAASPNALDWVSFELEQELLSKLPSVATRALVPLEYSETVVEAGGAARLVRWLDFDLQGPLELASIAADQLHVYARDTAGWQLLAESPTTPAATCWTVADLLVVDSSSPDRLRRTATDGAGESAASQSQWHDTFPMIIVGGPEGIAFHRINPAAGSMAERLLPPARATGLEEVRGVRALVPTDLDADGDLDLALSCDQAGNSPIQLWINRGNASFYRVDQHSQLPVAGTAIVDLIAADLDRDLDLDILTTDSQGQVGLLENLLHQQFRWQPLGWEGIRGTNLEVQELDGNVSWDVAACSNTGTEIQLTRMADRFSIQPLRRVTVATAGDRLRVVDLDNSSTGDLLTWGQTGVSVNRSPTVGAWGDVEPIHSAPINDLSVADQDGDGRLDLALATEDGVVALHSASELGHFLAVRVRGIDDNATGRVNHFAIGSTIELRSGPSYQAQIISSATTHFGLGDRTEADSLRIILTNGATQSIPQPRVDQLLREQQELKGSCPYLYAWNGERFEFITDCLWAAPLGLQVSRGKVAPDRPWEYLVVPGNHLQPRFGRYHLRLTEELWEIAYLDCLRLMAVDHPIGSRIFTNEKVGPPQIAEPHLYVLSQRRAIEWARDGHGTDLTELVSDADARFAVPYRQKYCQGLAEPHFVELNLGSQIRRAERVLLLLTGWILPTDTSLNLQIDQNPDWPRLRHPVLQVPAADGSWRDAVAPMGFPGGKTKTIVVDVTEVIDRDDPRVRIATTAMIQWDQIEIAVDPQELPSRTTDLTLASAELAPHGFSKLEPRDATQPHRYQYDRIWRGPRWAPIEGPMTAYGRCDGLLTGWDDQQVVMVGGDELQLTFESPDDPIPAGWQRDFVIYLVGWDKDADLNTLTGQSTLPLPFRGMRSYPPQADQVPTAHQVLESNRSHLTREQNFRDFWKSDFETPQLDWLESGP